MKVNISREPWEIDLLTDIGTLCFYLALLKKKLLILVSQYFPKMNRRLGPSIWVTREVCVNENQQRAEVQSR